MDFKESAKIVELEKRITALEKDISTLYNLIKSNINQNSVELEQNLTQGQENGANTQSRIHSQHNGEIISPTDLRYTNIYTRQHSFSNRRDDVADSALRTLLISIDSPRTPNGASISDSAKGNLTEPRNTAASRRGGAISRTGKEIETIYRKSLKCTELEKTEFQQFLVEFRQLNEKIEPDLEKKFNDNISKIIKEHNKQKPNVYVSQYEHFTQETMKKIRKEAFFLESYGYKVSQKNIDEIKKLLSQTQSKVMSL